MQKIFYGAPGTGKSFTIDEEIKNNSVSDERVFRTTFHPEYSYSDFIGQLLPTVKKNTGDADSTITYEFNKGIFTRALEKAYEDTSKEVYLILEEMSRGNCAAIFGDVFQLLDRENAGLDKGYSRYFINNEMLSKDIIALKDDKVKLPANLSIYGTVNTSDQNVFTMDTAFKRRFDWEYVSTRPVPVSKPYINNVDISLKDKNDADVNLSWIDLYGVLNKFISDSRWLDLGEDKQLGQFFIQFESNDPLKNKDKIKNKLLQFLWDDIHKIAYKSDVKLFCDEVRNFADLYDRYNEDKQIFSSTFLDCIELWNNGNL